MSGIEVIRICYSYLPMINRCIYPLTKGEGGGKKKGKTSVGIDPWFSQKIETFKKSPF
jgi:hypothetical protein